MRCSLGSLSRSAIASRCCASDDSGSGVASALASKAAHRGVAHLRISQRSRLMPFELFEPAQSRDHCSSQNSNARDGRAMGQAFRWRKRPLGRAEPCGGS
jgi:hypothetical protein